jgi:hypothetical protein
MTKYCDNVHRQEFTHVWAKNGQVVHMFNLIGTQNWEKAKVHVVLMAHWDTRPTADQEADPVNQAKPIPGANDGASGVAVLLELMHTMKDTMPAQVGVMYVMDDGEDLGPGIDEMFLGAVYFAQHLPTPKPDYGILLDMIGDKDLAIPREPESMRYAPELEKAFYLHAHSVGFRSTFPLAPGPDIEDDHLCMNQAGVPMIDLIDFSYDPWHTLQDTPDKCSADSLYKVGATLETWLKKPAPYGLKTGR